MMERTGRLLCGVLLLAAACGPEAPQPADPEEVSFEDERLIDLTSDGQAERVLVSARGPSYGDLTVQLDIVTAGDSLLFRDRWSSADYFAASPHDARADTTVQRIVRGHLTEVLRDTAFAGPALVGGARSAGGVLPDGAVVREDIAEFSWRRSTGLPDTLRLPPGARDQIRELMVSDDDVAVLVAELAAHPSFTYYTGADDVHTIAWSAQERRFIRIRTCC